MKRSYMKRGKSLNRRGRKVKAWDAVRAKLKKRFFSVGLVDCEFGFIPHDCWHSSALSFAHSRKRNDPEFDIKEVALACLPVHQILDEGMSHEAMHKAVRRAIEARKIQP